MKPSSLSKASTTFLKVKHIFITIANDRIKGFPNFDWQVEKGWFLYFGKAGGERQREEVLHGMALAVALGSTVDLCYGGWEVRQ